MKRLRLAGVFVGSRVEFDAMNRFIEQHQIKPVIDRVFPFSKLPAAFRYLESGLHFGKVVIEM